jgi:aryl-alcohol dehydrogenase-like predicted oxidoreductase
MKLALGTVQFGLSYGIANQKGQVSEKEVRKILKYAKNSNIDTIDTAIGYGDSEQCLGHVGVSNWKIITKLPEIPQDCKDIKSWINSQFTRSLNRLKMTHVKGILLHRPMQLLEPFGQEIWSAMQKIKKVGLVDKIGFSIYKPEELDQLWTDFQPDIIQSPFNILDQRLEVSGWLDKLHDNGIEVHVRSVFLQGLLLMNMRDRPVKFKSWDNLWKTLDEWLTEQKLTPLEACIGFVNSDRRINSIVVGVNSQYQLKQILGALTKEVGQIPKDLIITDQNLINPSNWVNL